MGEVVGRVPDFGSGIKVELTGGVFVVPAIGVATPVKALVGSGVSVAVVPQDIAKASRRGSSKTMFAVK